MRILKAVLAYPVMVPLALIVLALGTVVLALGTVLDWFIEKLVEEELSERRKLK